MASTKLGQGDGPADGHAALEAARAQARRLLEQARGAGNRRMRRKLYTRAFEFAQLAAVVEEEHMDPPPEPIIWPRVPPQRRHDMRSSQPRRPTTAG